MKHRLLIFSFVLFLLSSMGCGGQTSGNKQQPSLSKTTTVKTLSGDLKLPEPYATASTSRSSSVTGWKKDQKPTAPAGFTVTRYATDLKHPRWIIELTNKDIIVAESMSNRISIFRDTNGDGSPDLHEILISGLDMPFGMLYLDNYLYIATESAVTRYRYKPGEIKITAKGEKITTLPGGGHHWTRNIIANQSGTKIYVAIGSASDHAEDGIEAEKNRACILEMNPDGSGKIIYASGLRNPVGMAWQPGSGQLWTAVNERDGLGDDLPPDYITSVRKNGFYGWPYSYYGAPPDPRINPIDAQPDLVKKALVPDVPLGAHTASLGLAFYNHQQFPDKYRKGAFIGQHGSWNRSKLAGYRIAFVPFVNNRPGQPEDFLTGFISDASAAEVHGRPVGVTVLSDGSLLVADDAGNTIWKVTYNKR